MLLTSYQCEFLFQLTKFCPGVVKLKSSNFEKLDGVLNSCFMKVGVVCLQARFQHGLVSGLVPSSDWVCLAALLSSTGKFGVMGSRLGVAGLISVWWRYTCGHSKFSDWTVASDDEEVLWTNMHFTGNHTRPDKTTLWWIGNRVGTYMYAGNPPNTVKCLEDCSNSKQGIKSRCYVWIQW